MSRIPASLILLLLALTSCATTEPAVYSDSPTVSRADIQTAIQVVQRRCAREHRGVIPVFRIDVDRFDEIFVHCGPHYGVADAAGAPSALLTGRRRTLHNPGISPCKPDPEP